MLFLADRLGPGQATCIVIASVLVYGAVTLALLRRRPGKLWIPALFILVLATAFYWNVYDFAAARTWFPKLVLAILAAADLFVFKLTSSIGNLTDFFYLRDGVAASGVENPQVHLIFLQGLYICAIWTTSILIIHFVAGRLLSRFWLLFNSGRRDSRTHVFFGTGRLGTAVAKSLPAGERAVFVDIPAKETLPGRLSILGMFKGVRAGTLASDNLRKELPDAILLKARNNVGSCRDGSFFEDLGLKRLASLAGSEKNCLYLLSEDAEENLSALRKMQHVKAQVYYLAKREGVALRTDLSSPPNLHIVDTSYLATRALKGDESLYPVNLIKVAKDDDGEPAGYVCSTFNAMICGFGEGGRGALAFLYEFGTFVGRDGKASPFHCDVVDAHMHRLLSGYMASHPALDTERVSFISAGTESEEFRTMIREKISSLNYIFISLGDDGRNVDLAVGTLEAAYKCRRDLSDILILVKLDHPEGYRDLIAFFNDSYGGRETIRTVGDVDRTWTWDNISEEGYMRYARRFQASYSASTGDGISWERREESVRNKPGTQLAHRMELRRKTEQDFANYYHVKVKAALCPSYFWERPETANDIPVKYEGKHYTGTDAKAASVLEYMAVQEHLRWTASHEMAGYQYGAERREDLMTHPDMVPYESLDEATRHFDWIVVRTSLNILSGMKK